MGAYVSSCQISFLWARPVLVQNGRAIIGQLGCHQRARLECIFRSHHACCTVVDLSHLLTYSEATHVAAEAFAAELNTFLARRISAPHVPICFGLGNITTTEFANRCPAPRPWRVDQSSMLSTTTWTKLKVHRDLQPISALWLAKPLVWTYLGYLRCRSGILTLGEMVGARKWPCMPPPTINDSTRYAICSAVTCADRKSAHVHLRGSRGRLNNLDQPFNQDELKSLCVAP